MEEKQHYLFGMHPVLEAIASGRKFEKIVLKAGLEGPQFRELMELIKKNDIPFQFVPAQKMNYLVKGSHQGVVAYMSQIDYVPFEKLMERVDEKGVKAPLVVLLGGVSDVRNFGAIARTCECAGVEGIILPAKGGAAINADAIKTSAGALLRIPVSKVTNLKVAAYYLLESGYQLVAATEKADGVIYDIDFNKPTAIIMGSEGKGISPALLSICSAQAKIPMMGEIGSLNVSVATSILLFEAVRQKMK